MENESFVVDNAIGKLIIDSTFVSAKLDVLIESNALILSKLNNTEYSDERNKLHDKVTQLHKIYIDDLKKQSV